MFEMTTFVTKVFGVGTLAANFKALLFMNVT